MLDGQRIAVVIPAYNEESHIGTCLAVVPDFVDRLYVVDDASQDGTAAAVGDSTDPRVCLVRHEVNGGVGAAIITGYLAAHGEGLDLAVVMAGDAQMHPDDMPGLLLPLLRGKADFVKGDRLAWPDARRVVPPARLAGIRALEVLTRWSTGLRDFGDFQCGYTGLRLAMLDRLDLSKVYPRYGFPNDLLSHLVLAGARIAERPVRPIYDGQRSDLKIHRVTVPILWMLAKGFSRRLRHHLTGSPSWDRSSSSRAHTPHMMGTTEASSSNTSRIASNAGATKSRS
jgi:glycosyltransferase involved in cell wall biosynthesis